MKIIVMSPRYSLMFLCFFFCFCLKSIHQAVRPGCYFQENRKKGFVRVFNRVSPKAPTVTRRLIPYTFIPGPICTTVVKAFLQK